MLTSKPIDLGTITFGKPHSFSFTIRNEGTKPIVLNKLIVGCTSCTKATTKVTIVGVGAETTVDVVYTPGTIGPSNKKVSVLYDEDKELKLEFKANVQQQD